MLMPSLKRGISSRNTVMVDVWIMAPAQARRGWLLRAVSEDRAIRVAGVAPTFPFLRSLMSETSADLAVVDLQSPPDSALARDWLFELMAAVPVLLVDFDFDQAVFNRILQARTGGMLQAEASSEQIIHAIRSVASGLMIFDSALMPRRSEDETLLEPLTARETEVLRLLADGLGNKEIAVQLNISEHTIKFHIRSILGKLGASSRTEAVSRGLRSGLIEL
ncbi:MAG TPA: response regulator transcription factor [Terriglobia bacterium]|nr:response regulator transcription factor [Terriglobia bacterium]